MKSRIQYGRVAPGGFKAIGYTAALNALALTKKQLGSFDRVSHVVRLGVFVAAKPQCIEHAKVADAASEFFRNALGENTISSRLVIGVASRPLGSPVELEVIIEVTMGGFATDMAYIRGQNNASYRQPPLYEDTPQ